MENKKRKVREGEGEGEDEDEMKMEKFYALLRSFRDARDRRRRELVELEKQDKPAATTTTTKPQVSFEFQDFTTDIQFRKPPFNLPNPVSFDTAKDKKKNQQQQDHLALDLKLAL